MTENTNAPDFQKVWLDYLDTMSVAELSQLLEKEKDFLTGSGEHMAWLHDVIIHRIAGIDFPEPSEKSRPLTVIQFKLEDSDGQLGRMEIDTEWMRSWAHAKRDMIRAEAKAFCKEVTQVTIVKRIRYDR